MASDDQGIQYTRAHLQMHTKRTECKKLKYLVIIEGARDMQEQGHPVYKYT